MSARLHTVFVGLLTMVILMGITVPSAITLLTNPYGSVVESPETTKAAYEALEEAGIDSTGIKIVVMESLDFWFSDIEPAGYVSGSTSDEIIHILPIDQFESPLAFRSTLLHEYGHILQLRLLSSPVTSLHRYIDLVSLNETLSVYNSEDFQSDALFAGIESNAECLAQVLWWHSVPGYFDRSWRCEGNAFAAARAIVEGRYPDPSEVAYWSEVIAAEKAAIPPKEMSRASNHEGE